MNDTRLEDFERFNPQAAGKNLDRLPWQIRACVERFQDYYHNPELIPKLSRLEHRQNLTGENRLRRSERRAAHSLILCALALQFDFGSSQVGNPTLNGDFYYTPLTKLAEIAGLALIEGEEESEEIAGVSQRFARAWRDLKEAGIVCVIERFQEVEVEKNGRVTLEKRAVSAIKYMNPQLFVEVGALTTGQLRHFQEYAKAGRVSMPSRKSEAAKLRRKIYKRKPRMSARIRAIYQSLWVNMLKLYRELRKAVPGQHRDWYRGKIKTAFG